MKVLTANRLTDGVVVYRNTESHWIRDVRFAQAIQPEAAATELAIAQRDVDGNLVVGVELIDVNLALDTQTVEPNRLRERIRAFGPTIDYRATGRKPVDIRVAA